MGLPPPSQGVRAPEAGREPATISLTFRSVLCQEKIMAKVVKAKPTNGAVFSPKITLKNGRVIYAADYGLKAFCFSAKTRKK
jgi:hypothetical protein